jgi:hypothetical protein
MMLSAQHRDVNPWERIKRIGQVSSAYTTSMAPAIVSISP